MKKESMCSNEDSDFGSDLDSDIENNDHNIDDDSCFIYSSEDFDSKLSQFIFES